MAGTYNFVADDGATDQFSSIVRAHILDGKTRIAGAADRRHVPPHRNGDRLPLREFRHEACINPIRH
jgi:hypothetical protein